MGYAKDYGDIVAILMVDSTLKTLMDIPVNEQTEYGILADKYIMQTYVSDKFTDDGVCRILVRAGVQMETTNEFVLWNGVIIEVYVPKFKDLAENFQTRINQIVDRLIILLNRQLINDNKLYFKNAYEQVSESINFKRYYVKFEYKKVIH
jgi:hypothetical protein